MRVGAIGAVIEDAYGRMGQAAIVFLSADGVDVEVTPSLCQSLGDGVPPTCRPASARVTGDPGASIALSRFSEDEDGRVSVVASYVQTDGTGRGCTRYVLDHDLDGWTIVEASDAWPDCPISGQGEGSYHDAIRRAHGGECLRFGTAIGTCGQWLYVSESTGYDGTESYFDLQSGLIVAQQIFTDAEETTDVFVFGEVACEPIITETISCDRP